MVRTVIAVFRASRFSVHLCYGLTIAIFYPWLSFPLRRLVLQNWSSSLLSIFNVRIGLGKDDLLRSLRHGLIVTNHISWLDVFVLNAVIPMRFVAKSEVRRWPVIGWLCTRAQTLYLERGNARAAARINVQLANLLRRGECLAIFPEGTTTDGASVRHFHASLLQPAIDANATIFPVALRYTDSNGNRSTAAAYADEISFGTSLWRILTAPELNVYLIATPALDTEQTDRQYLAQQAQHQIALALNGLDSHQARQPAESPARHEDQLGYATGYGLLLQSPTLRKKLARASE